MSFNLKHIRLVDPVGNAVAENLVLPEIPPQGDHIVIEGKKYELLPLPREWSIARVGNVVIQNVIVQVKELEKVASEQPKQVMAEVLPGRAEVAKAAVEAATKGRGNAKRTPRSEPVKADKQNGSPQEVIG